MSSIKFIWEFAVWGGVGGLVATLAKCGYIELPTIKDRRIYLGGLQGIMFGIIAGLIGDSNSLNALLWGAGGTTIITGVFAVAEKQAKCIVKNLEKEVDK